MCAEKLGIAADLLNLGGSASARERARVQLLALLLNVAASNLGLGDIISKDGANVSQAIAYCDQLIDSPTGNHSLAASIAEKINSGQRLNSGVIPLTTPTIQYARQDHRAFRVTPNPTAGPRIFEFSLPSSAVVELAIFDISGRRLATVHDGRLSAGPHRIRWMPGESFGSALPRGIYYARLRAGDQEHRLTLVQLSQ
jgi:hypothetical protein